jgi:hypothetical protein
VDQRIQQEISKLSPQDINQLMVLGTEIATVKKIDEKAKSAGLEIKVNYDRVNWGSRDEVSTELSQYLLALDAYIFLSKNTNDCGISADLKDKLAASLRDPKIFITTMKTDSTDYLNTLPANSMRAIILNTTKWPQILKGVPPSQVTPFQEAWALFAFTSASQGQSQNQVFADDANKYLRCRTKDIK